MVVTFREWTCLIKPGFYGNGRLALQLFDIDTREKVTNATVNLPEYPLPDGHVFVNGYGDKADLLDALMAAAIVSAPVGFFPSGFVMVPMCRLLIDAGEI